MGIYGHNKGKRFNKKIWGNIKDDFFQDTIHSIRNLFFGFHSSVLVEKRKKNKLHYK